MKNKHRVISTLTASLLATIFANSAQAQDAAIKVLVEQGRYWASQGRNDRAADAWTKLLRLQPDNPEALAGLTSFELDNNRPENARKYYTLLREKHPNYAGLKKLEDGMLYRSSDKQVLEEARQQAQSGQTDQALSSYKRVFGNKVPQSGELALEYYQTLGGNAAGWEEGRKGLERLMRENPGSRKYELAYAQHLSFREGTRRESIRLLSQLAKRDDTAKAATDSWRKALIWLDAKRSDEPLYNAYLATQKDEAVANRLEVLKNPPKAELSERDIALTQAFSSLNQGDLNRAAAQFESMLKEKPNDADALGGLGVIRLKQQRFSEAETLLSRAHRGGSSKWGQPLATARFWGVINRADAERRQGNYERAKGLYLQASQIDSSKLLPLLNLADLYFEDGQYDQAEQIYRKARQRDPSNLQAVRGLLSTLSLQERQDEAVAIAQQLTDEQREKMGGFGQIRAQQLRSVARAAEKRGDLDIAQQNLEDAILFDPDDAWSRLDLARLYQKLGAPTQARAVIDGLLISHGDLPEALHASAILSAEFKDWTEGLYALERIQPQVRTKEMAQLQRRLWVNAQVERASLAVRQGQLAEAQQIARQVEPVAGKDVELLGLMAGLYADLGDDARALAMIRSLLGQSLRVDPGIRLQYASILLKTRQDAELVAQMRQLYTMPLNDQQRSDLDNLRIAYTLRHTDTLREAGNYAGAYESIAPVVAETPDDLRLQQAMARLYVSAGDYSEGLRWYEQTLLKEPNNLDARVAYAGAALADKRYNLAAQAIDVALRQAPDNPRVLAMAGRVFRGQGQTQKAAEYYRAALAAERGATPDQAGALGMRFVDYRLPVAPANSGFGGRSATTPYIPNPLLNTNANTVSNNGSSQVAAPSNTAAIGAAQPSNPYIAPAVVAPSRNNQASPVNNPNSYPGSSQLDAYASGLARLNAPAGYPQAPSVGREVAPQIPIVPIGQRPTAPLPKPLVPNSFEGFAPAPASSTLPARQSAVNRLQDVLSQRTYHETPSLGNTVVSDPVIGMTKSVKKANVETLNVEMAVAATPVEPIIKPQQIESSITKKTNPSSVLPVVPTVIASNQVQQPAQSVALQAQISSTLASKPEVEKPTIASVNNKFIAVEVESASTLPVIAATPQSQLPFIGKLSTSLTAFPSAMAAADTLTAQVAPAKAMPENPTPLALLSQAKPLPEARLEPLKEVKADTRVERALSLFVSADKPRVATTLAMNESVKTTEAQTETQIQPGSRFFVKTEEQRPAAPASAAQPAPYYPSYRVSPAERQLAPGTPIYARKRDPSLAEELADLEAQRSSTVSAGVYTRSRAGEAGMSQLQEVQTPIEGRVAMGYDGHMVLKMAPTLLDAGSLSYSDPGVSNRFGDGRGSLARPAIGAKAISATGVGMSIGYEGKKLGFDIGTTPLGFEVVDFTGGIKWKDNIDRLGFAIDVSQRPVTDSVLSYAGVKDQFSGLVFGGVRAAGGRVDLNYELDRAGIYGLASYHVLNGKNVASNSRYEVGGGAYYKVIKEADREFTTGVSTTLLGYDKNLSYYTLGHGGYFSPQRYFSISIPLDYSGRSGRMAYQIRSAVGIQSFTQDDVDYHPSNADWQRARESVLSDNPQFSSYKTRYDSQNKTGLGYNLGGNLEYQVAPQLYLGVYGGLDNAQNYRQAYGMAYFRYSFAPSYSPISFPPRGLRPYY